MKVLWLGQGGLLFVCGKKKIMIDPYLTNSLSLIDYTLDRRMKINRKIFNVRPDVIILTNCHPDHADIETLSKFARKQKGKLTILSCESVFLQIADNGHCALANNIMLEPGSEWSIDGFNIQAVIAKTDDKSAIGVVITDTRSGKKYYVAGDTLYSKHVLNDLPNDIFAVFVPINGEYGSMNVIDAKRFALATGARHAVPVHFGMLDKIDPESFDTDNAIIPKIYRIIDFESGTYTDNKEIDRKFNEKDQKSKSAKNDEADEPAQLSIIEDKSDNMLSAPDVELDADGGIEVEVKELCVEADETEIEVEVEELCVEAYETEIEVEVEELCVEADETEIEVEELCVEADETEIEVEVEEIIPPDMSILYDEPATDEAIDDESDKAIDDESNVATSDDEDTEAEGISESDSEAYDALSVAIEGGYDEELDTEADSYNDFDDEPDDTNDKGADSDPAYSSAPSSEQSDEDAKDFGDFDDTDDYSDFDDFDEDGEQLEFEPFTSEDLLAYCSDNSSDEADATDTSNEESDSNESEADDSDEETDGSDKNATDDAPDEDATDDEEEGDLPVSTYTSRQSSDQDEADLIDAFVKELEKLDRGETPDFSKQ